MTIEEYLKQWEGYTADEVANILRWKGMKGTPRSTSWCPINRDIKRETGRLDTRNYGQYLTTKDGEYDTPLGLEQFSTRFDHGELQDLIDDRTPPSTPSQ